MVGASGAATARDDGQAKPGDECGSNQERESIWVFEHSDTHKNPTSHTAQNKRPAEDFPKPEVKRSVSLLNLFHVVNKL